MAFITFGTLIFLIFMVTLLYSFFVWKHRKTYFAAKDIPGPLSLPILGIGYKLATLSSNDIIDFMYKLLKNYNGFTKVWFGPKLIVLVTKPEHCYKILGNPKSMGKDYLYRFIDKVTGPGLMTAPVVTWRKHRKALMPAFNQKILDSFVEIFAEKSNILNAQLDKIVGKRDVDLFTHTTRCTLDIICETAMGINMHQQTDNSDFAENLERLEEIVQCRIFHIWYHLDFTFNFFPMAREYEWRLNQFHDFISKIIKAKIKAREEKIRKQNDPSYTHEGEAPSKLAFLDLIMENSNFTFEELMSEVNIFIIAGTDTSSVTLCSILMMMGMYPEVQQEVLEEILEVIGPDREILPSDLPRLKVMERVIKESSRLFPVGAYFLRQLEGDIDIGDAVLPKGSSVLFNAVYINRNPEYWPDPFKFDPDRFLPENAQKRHPCAFISFSNGPRNCIGARYAVLSLKVMTAIVLRKFKVHCDYKRIEDIRLKTKIVLRHRDGCKVWFERR